MVIIWASIQRDQVCRKSSRCKVKRIIAVAGTSKLSVENSAQNAHGHNRDLLLALSRAAQSVQRARTEEEVYQAVGSQIKSLGGEVALFTVTEDEDKWTLTLAHITYMPEVLRRVEKLLGKKALGYRVKLQPGSIYTGSLESGQTQYVRWAREDISNALPPPLDSLAGQLMKLLKIEYGIIAPLRADEKVLGLMIVNGSSLTGDDLPAMESFAAQIAISLRNVRLTQQMQSELSARRQVEENLRLQSAALESAANAIAITDRNGTIRWVNLAWTDLTGYTREESIGRSPRLVKSGLHTVQFYRDLWEKILAGQVWHGEMTNRRKDGSLYQEEQTITPVLDGEGNITHFIAIKSDITRRKQAEAELKLAREELEKANHELQSALRQQQHLARTDSLTGVHNRRYLFERAGHEFDLARRYRHPLSIIMFDLDHFKQINDTFGHAMGDQMLERMAGVARSQLRDVDLIGRYGGEEFMIVLPMTEAKQASLLAERIHKGVRSLRIEAEKGPASITLSAGVAEMSHDPMDTSVDDIIRRADEALYAAKQAGRNCTMIFDPQAGGTA